MKKAVIALILVLVALIGCRRDVLEGLEPDAASTRDVVFDLDSVPYATLSHYQFFQGAMANLVPANGVLPYEPITSLFSDYAHKKRFVWMPPGSHATYASDSTVLEFPEGAVLIKNFYYDHVQPANTRQLMETRMLIRKNGVWIFANYIWNAEQTEATYSLSGSSVPVIFATEQDEFRCVTYRIPTQSECHTCHKLYDVDIPIGPKPQNLNSVIQYADGPMNQLAKWESVGYLAPGYPLNINTVVDWSDATQDLELRVRAYLDMNCAHCHSTGRHCDYRPMRFAWNETTDPVNLGVCMEPEDPIDLSQTHLVAAGNAGRSMMVHRMSSVDEAVRMPLMGRTVVHDEAVELVSTWINSLNPPCP